MDTFLWSIQGPLLAPSRPSSASLAEFPYHSVSGKQVRMRSCTQKLVPSHISWHADMDGLYVFTSTLVQKLCLCLTVTLNLALNHPQTGQLVHDLLFCMQVCPLATTLFICDIDECLDISAGTLATLPGCQKVHHATLSSQTEFDADCLIRLDICMSLAVSELSQLSSLQLSIAVKHET